MKEYLELSPVTSTMLEKAFLSHPLKPDQQQRIETIKNKLEQTARFLVKYSPGSPEQTLAVRALQEAFHWSVEAIEKNE